MREIERRALIAVLTLLEEGSFYETDIHHKVYFIGELAGESFGHVPQMYGPHSNVVSQQVGALVSAGLVEEEVSDQPLEHGPKRPRWYRLSEGGAAANAARPESLARYGEHARTVARPSAIADAVTVAARAHQRAKHDVGTGISDAEARKAIGELGFEPISNYTANRAVAYLREVGLVVEAPEGPAD